MWMRSRLCLCRRKLRRTARSGLRLVIRASRRKSVGGVWRSWIVGGRLQKLMGMGGHWAGSGSFIGDILSQSFGTVVLLVLWCMSRDWMFEMWLTKTAILERGRSKLAAVFFSVPISSFPLPKLHSSFQSCARSSASSIMHVVGVACQYDGQQPRIALWGQDSWCPNPSGTMKPKEISREDVRSECCWHNMDMDVPPPLRRLHSRIDEA